ncbi:FAD/FMN-containing isoamyl alcohol oxidase MreA [Corynespora cassiicola Philippines]|uniref:FAD/FMN-containing isoamyl alcohol oxidase MreA n=1 Tax=Corynespora cassiicola Philippines TaxID=1448308 RepID=A0A2T2N0J7_CORCC|nr:FAD/FMN-containing isoamyl alcohol oxidase MreA [Corynespora cassiicola Philippines]
MPGDSCWPSDADWAALNTTVRGNLIRTVPIGSICHTNQPFAEYDVAKCDALRATWNVPDTHIGTSSSLAAPFFANQSCDPFSEPLSQCVIGTYVQYSVRASSVSDYIAAINFAKSRNIRLVIRNTAHDYHGRSTGAGALAIWTHHLKDIGVIDKFSSKYYSGKAMKFGAGVQFFEAYEAAKAKGLVVLGGNCPTVGIAGGYTQGAGTSLLGSRFGLSADQVLAWEVVTANGKLRTATPVENQDLYWALSGGGGGTYGVVLSVTVKAYPDSNTSGAHLDFSNDGISQDAFYAAVSVYLKNTLRWIDAGAVGNFLLTENTFSVDPIIGYGLQKSELDQLLEPTLKYLYQQGIKYNYTSKEFPNFLDAYNEMNVDTGVALFQIGGRIIPRSVVSQSVSLTEALRTINSKGGIISGMSLNVGKKPYAANAVHPAWRETAISVVMGTLWSNTNWEQNIQNQKLMTNVLVPELDKVLAKSRSAPAAYSNNADWREPNWRSVFYGPNYSRLLAVKTKYDPLGLFWARISVGSEAWAETAEGRLCRT